MFAVSKGTVFFFFSHVQSSSLQQADNLEKVQVQWTHHLSESNELPEGGRRLDVQLFPQVLQRRQDMMERMTLNMNQNNGIACQLIQSSANRQPTLFKHQNTGSICKLQLSNLRMA